jgi:hypothetical protein
MQASRSPVTIGPRLGRWPPTAVTSPPTVSARRSGKQKQEQEHPMDCLFALMIGLFPRPGRRLTAA